MRSGFWVEAVCGLLLIRQRNRDRRRCAAAETDLNRQAYTVRSASFTPNR